MARGKNVTLSLNLRSRDRNAHYNGKSVQIDASSHWVCFVSLMKAVVKTCSTKYINATWADFLSELDDDDKQMVSDKKDTAFIHVALVSKFVKDRSSTCKKSWGLFYADGLQQLKNDIKELGGKKKEEVNVSDSESASKDDEDTSSAPLSVMPVESQRKRKHSEKQAHSNDETLMLFSDTFQDREHVLVNREKAIAQREQVLNAREDLLVKREQKVQKLRKEVQQMKEEVASEQFNARSQNDIVSNVNQFLIQVRGLQKKLTEDINNVVNKQQERPSPPQTFAQQSKVASAGTDRLKELTNAVSNIEKGKTIQNATPSTVNVSPGKGALAQNASAFNASAVNVSPGKGAHTFARQSEVAQGAPASAQTSVPSDRVAQTFARQSEVAKAQTFARQSEVPHGSPKPTSRPTRSETPTSSEIRGDNNRSRSRSRHSVIIDDDDE